MSNLAQVSFCRRDIGFYLAILLLIGMPVWMGGTSHSARMTLYFLGISLPLIVIIQDKTLYRVPGTLPLCLFCAWLLFQTVPLPPFLLHTIAPGYSSLIDQGYWLLDPDAWRPLSLNPSATLDEFFRYCSYTGFYLAMTSYLFERKKLRRTVVLLSCFFGIYALLGLIQFFAPADKVFWLFAHWPERTSHHFATYVNGNHYASLICMIFPLLVITTIINFPTSGYGNWREKLIDLFTDRELSRGLLFGLLAVLVMVSVFFSLSRGGTLSLFGSGFVLFILLAMNKSLKGRMLVFVIVLISSIGLCAFFGWDPLMKRFADIFYETGGVKDQRLIYWRDSLDLFSASPFAGSGAGTFVDAYPNWQTAQSHGLVVDHAHNDYIELLTDLGLTGLFLVLWFWWSLVRAAVPAWKKRHNEFSRLVGIAVASGLVAILLHSITDFNLAIPANGLYLFLLFSLLTASSHKTSRSGETVLPVLNGRSKRSAVLTLSVVLTGFLLFFGGGLYARWHFSRVENVNFFKSNESQKQEVKNKANLAGFFAPYSANYLFAAATAHATLGELDAARSAIQKSLAIRPFDQEALRLAARILFAEGDMEGAEKILKGATKTSPLSWDVRSELAEFYLQTGRAGEAFDVYREGLNISPSQTSQVLQSLVLHGIARSKMIESMPSVSYPWSVYGDFLLQMGDLGAAEQTYRRGLSYALKETEPGTQIFWRYLSFLSKSNRNAEALELLRTALDKYPGNPYFLARQGVLYEKENLHDLAIESYRNSLLLDPRQDWLRKRLKSLTEKRAR